MIVGCPIYKRVWILPKWYSHVLVAAREAGVHDLGFVFVVDEADVDTIACIEHVIKLPTKIVKVSQQRAAEGHAWNTDRFNEMVFLRNTLLQTVRAIDPDLFLSLDSDILLHPMSIKNMMEGLEKFDAVGGKTYMSPGTFAPSYAMLGQAGNLVRDNSDGNFPVDCIMAIKLMTQRAYWVDYAYDDKGEDIGWCKAVKKKGYGILWEGRVCSKHVMEKEMLESVDERCGF